MKKVLFYTFLSSFLSLQAQAIKFSIDPEIEGPVTFYMQAQHKCVDKCKKYMPAEEESWENTIGTVNAKEPLIANCIDFMRSHYHPHQEWVVVIYALYKNQKYEAPSFKIRDSMAYVETFPLENQHFKFDGTKCANINPSNQ